jgi:hypothetical protein
MMELKVGTVTSNMDITQTGLFYAVFDDSNSPEPVQYVSPYGNSEAAFIAIPLPGSQVLVGYDATKSTTTHAGFYYLGSILGALPSLDNKEPFVGPIEGGGDIKNPDNFQNPITGKPEGPAVMGPPSPEGVPPENPDYSPLPDSFKGMYEGRGVVPEMMGLASTYGDALLLNNRYRAGENAPFQDHKIELKSGAGKTIRLVDSPQVDAIVIANEHLGKDYIVFSTGNSKESPFAAGEFHLRTHGPINQYTIGNNMHFWVEEGRNVEIENKASGMDSTLLASDPLRANQPLEVDDEDDVKERIYDFGDETWGCVKLWSDNNNIAVSALADDAVIHLHTPGANSKVVVHAAGTVDIVADKKITLQSKTEVEINAPIVDINGKDFVYVDGGQVHLNQPHLPQPDWDF